LNAWLVMEGLDGYVPWWYANIRLSRMFPGHRLDFWETHAGRIWARRIWAAEAAEHAQYLDRKARGVI
jgi:hypothetical protein